MHFVHLSTSFPFMRVYFSFFLIFFHISIEKTDCFNRISCVRAYTRVQLNVIQSMRGLFPSAPILSTIPTFPPLTHSKLYYPSRQREDERHSRSDKVFSSTKKQRRYRNAALFYSSFSKSTRKTQNLYNRIAIAGKIRRAAGKG